MRILFATVIPMVVVVAAVLLVLMFPAQHIVRGVMVNVNALFEFSKVIPATVSLVQGHLEGVKLFADVHFGFKLVGGFYPKSIRKGGGTYIWDRSTKKPYLI